MGCDRRQDGELIPFGDLQHAIPLGQSSRRSVPSRSLAAAGFVTYQALFNRSRFFFPGTLLLSLGLPWTRTLSEGIGWPALLVSFAVNAGMLYFIGSRFERLSRPKQY